MSEGFIFIYLFIFIIIFLYTNSRRNICRSAFRHAAFGTTPFIARSPAIASQGEFRSPRARKKFEFVVRLRKTAVSELKLYVLFLTAFRDASI